MLHLGAKGLYISNTSTTGKISDRAEVKLTILEAVVKGYHECSFAVRVGDKFFVKQKRGDRGPTLRATDDDRGQLGHLQRKLVTLLWPTRKGGKT